MTAIPLFYHEDHKALWNWMADQIRPGARVPDKSGWPGWEEHSPQSRVGGADCFACMFAQREQKARQAAPYMDGGWCHDACMYCPLGIKVSSGNEDGCLGGAYTKYQEAIHSASVRDSVGIYVLGTDRKLLAEARRCARVIANLPLRNDCEWEEVEVKL